MSNPSCFMDLVVCMDQSESMMPDEYSQLQVFVCDIIRNFPEQGPLTNQVAVLAFDNLVDQIFALNTYTNVDREIDAVLKHKQGGGTTRIDLAIRFSATINGLRDRNLYKRVLLLLTDGRSSQGSYMDEALASSNEAGFTRVAVGVGCQINDEELRKIAGERVFFVEDFEGLSGLTTDVANSICFKMPTDVPGIVTRSPFRTYHGQTPNPTDLFEEIYNNCAKKNRGLLADDGDSGGFQTEREDVCGGHPYATMRNFFDTSKYDKWPPCIKGANWRLIARQSEGYFFRPFELTLNPDLPDSANFALLAELENYRGINSMFIFMLHYPFNNVSNIWMQSNNPAIDRGEVRDYIPLVLGDERLGWRGLKFDGKCSLMKGTEFARRSYYAVGAFYDLNGKIPGFMPLDGVKRVELYVLPPNESLVLCRPPPEIPGTRKNQSSRALEGKIVTYECEGGRFGFSGQPFQDAVCMRLPSKDLLFRDKACRVEKGVWIGVPRVGDCVCDESECICDQSCKGRQECREW